MTLGFLRNRRKEKTVYPVKNGYLIEKELASKRNPLHTGSFGLTHSFSGAEDTRDCVPDPMLRQDIRGKVAAYKRAS